MKYIEIILLVMAYTLIVITLFLEFVCYKKKLEKLETIAFTFSLLLLIVSMTISPLLEQTSTVDTTNVFTLLSMVFVGLTTPLSIMVERQHAIPPFGKKLLYVISIVLFLATGIAYFMDALAYVEYIVVVFLMLAVVFSMLLVRTTKPKPLVVHREKIERIFSVVVLVVVLISLLANYVFMEAGYDLKIGFTLPLVFILLSGNKLFDDLQRLSILKPKMEPKEQHFKNYAISEREKEVVILLIQGKTYKQISEALHIAMPTVKTHASTIYKKCGVRNRTELSALLNN